MALEFVDPAATPVTLNMLLYGPPKVGKSVAAASAPGPVLYLNADSKNALLFARRKYGDAIREVEVEGLQTLVEATLYLQQAPGVQSVVLDPLSDVHRVLLEEASKRAIRPKIQEYGDVTVHIERFCRSLCDLPVNVVFVAHETPIKDEESGGFERLPFTGTNNPALGAKLLAMVDVIGYCGIKQPEGDGEPQYLAQLINGGGRRGGDRTGMLGAARALDLSEWVAAASAPVNTETEAKAA